MPLVLKSQITPPQRGQQWHTRLGKIALGGVKFSKFQHLRYTSLFCMIGDASLQNRLMETLPLVSVVIPCFNAERYIAATIQSVVAQAWPNLEIIVVDDGSSDGSAELIERTFPEVRLIRQANQGVAVARNTGIAQAQGEWIAFLDADDIWIPGKLHAQHQMLQAVPGARVSYTAWQVWHSTEPEPASGYVSALIDKYNDKRAWTGASGWVYPQLLLDCVVWTSTVLAHRSVFAEVGDFDPTLRIGEDYDLWLRASRVTQILRVSVPYALYRMHPASITRKVPDINYRNLVVSRAIDKWGYRSPDGSAARPEEVSRAIAISWSDFAWAHYLAKNYARAIRASVDAVWADWRLVSAWKTLLKSAALWALRGRRGS
jgi:glycosyltransferase involved in cell wall biosynthesis